MNIFIYGDSNTFGQVPNIDGYSKEAKIERYNKEEIWWYPLTMSHNVIVNGLSGRAINNENPWLLGRNATSTILEDLNGLNPNLIIIQLGTNDCKSRYALSAEEITKSLELFIKIIKNKVRNSQILVISPAIIKEGNKITDKYYVGAEKKSKELDVMYYELCKQNRYLFVSGFDSQVGEDGEHLTALGHNKLREKVLKVIKNIHTNENFNLEKNI